ncbi:MAG: histidinol dehydrogenase [Gemmatimonadetes bacterium]|nr:histidinol dehydrogenase [Gemmatimonadota bacterium]
MQLKRLSVPPFEPLAQLMRGIAVADQATRDRVSRIIAAVRAEGDYALEKFQRELDHSPLDPVEWSLPPSRWHQALERLDPAVREALECAVQRIRDYHQRHLVLTPDPYHSWRQRTTDGVYVGERTLPLDRVGVYVPGGQAAYPSTVLMNVIPARAAGVQEVIVVTPPTGITDAVLAACALAKVDRLFQVGGAHAVAALAFGTATIPKVDKIVGPGNRWVAEAKRQLTGVVGIDMIAGPTEVVVIADESADPRYVAADLIAQAEHDEDATAWLVTPSESLAALVDEELDARLAVAPRGEVARRSLERNGRTVIVPDVKTAIEVANRRAPEHLELLIREARSWVDQVRHAGAVFVGYATPEAVGDYVAGPSHVLPTSGTARFASPLGVYDFVKRMSIIEYSAEKLELDARAIISLAQAEGLLGHADAVRVRLDPHP